ncbi:MAG: YggS family pyridoxal phosphate-dependent enzyme [Candidatus Heimdallarchaeota archaeon]|nr:MAG: YggS family pyridoxal phosphate-dependent enzyme [Candidatus Heimdallarchaeota archaeon]
MIKEDRVIKNYHNMLSMLEKYSYSGEKPKLVMVTKDQPVNFVQKVLNQLERPIIGENRVQEALSKIEICGSSKAEWHFIGHLQRNKVKKILGKFSLIHSLDRLPLAQEIEKRAAKENLMVRCLLQVDISQNGSKFGFHPSDDAIKDVLREMESFSNLKIEGLMTIAPFVSPEDTRKYFKRMRSLFDNIMHYDGLPQNVEMKVLSMGMSNDYVIALEEGSTMIRLGRRIFG